MRKLYIGNKNYSSWSLRPWLLMRQAELAFHEVRIPLYMPQSRAQILSHSPSGKVPCLLDGDLAVWDSLAIVELVLALEEEFELDIPDEETEKIRTVQDAVDYITSHSSKR